MSGGNNYWKAVFCVFDLFIMRIRKLSQFLTLMKQFGHNLINLFRHCRGSIVGYSPWQVLSG